MNPRRFKPVRNRSRLYERLLADPAPLIAIREFEKLLVAFGFEQHPGRGSHRNKHPHVPVTLTVQPRGKDAVRYQVKRLLAVIEEYNLHIRP